eukprot:TRINITY_DN16309_c0_g1_i1.p1 TRINITY_DN16309_c0_g1~~TRINITY_DN16309_c0_g1_i1.p1  ORF type:complete len:682 (-),score=18.95 TRINITY_DN16309_c0_g1_i1:186-2231(-)
MEALVECCLCAGERGEWVLVDFLERELESSAARAGALNSWLRRRDPASLGVTFFLVKRSAHQCNLALRPLADLLPEPSFSHAELDPRKRSDDDPRSSEDHLQSLLKVLDTAMDCITGPWGTLPLPVRAVLAKVREIGAGIAQRDMSLKVVAMLTMSRMWITSIFTPGMCGLVPKAGGLGLGVMGLPRHTLRTLILMSKTLQNLGNGVRFNKEEYLMCLNPWIESNIPRMNHYVDRISSLSSEEEGVVASMKGIGMPPVLWEHVALDTLLALNDVLSRRVPVSEDEIRDLSDTERVRGEEVGMWRRWHALLTMECCRTAAEWFGGERGKHEGRALWTPFTCASSRPNNCTSAWNACEAYARRAAMQSENVRLMVTGTTGSGKRAFALRYASGHFFTRPLKTRQFRIHADGSVNKHHSVAVHERGEKMTISVEVCIPCGSVEALEEEAVAEVDGVLFLVSPSDEIVQEERLWEDLERAAAAAGTAPLMLVANKTDLVCGSSAAAFSRHRFKRIASSIGACYVEASTRHDINVNAAFREMIVRAMMHRRGVDSMPPPHSSDLYCTYMDPDSDAGAGLFEYGPAFLEMSKAILLVRQAGGGLVPGLAALPPELLGMVLVMALPDHWGAAYSWRSTPCWSPLPNPLPHTPFTSLPLLARAAGGTDASQHGETAGSGNRRRSKCVLC